MIGIDGIAVVMIVVMEEYLPLIQQLRIGRLRIAHTRGEVHQSLVKGIYKGTVRRTSDCHIWWRIIYRYSQALLGRQPSAIGDSQCHNKLRWYTSWSREGVSRIG